MPVKLTEIRYPLTEQHSKTGPQHDPPEQASVAEGAVPGLSPDGRGQTQTGGGLTVLKARVNATRLHTRLTLRLLASTAPRQWLQRRLLSPIGQPSGVGVSGGNAAFFSPLRHGMAFPVASFLAKSHHPPESRDPCSVCYMNTRALSGGTHRNQPRSNLPEPPSGNLAKKSVNAYCTLMMLIKTQYIIAQFGAACLYNLLHRRTSGWAGDCTKALAGDLSFYQ